MIGHIDMHFIKDEFGYRTNYSGNILSGSGIRYGESGKPWRGFDPTAKNRHWAIPKAVLDDIDEDLSDLSTHQKLDRLFELGYVKIKPGVVWPYYERYLKPNDGQPLNDIWAFQPYTDGTVLGTKDGIDEDIHWLSTSDKERLGYPTQKPEGLLERIIRSCTDENDLILDPFCGCGTAIVAAEKLHRRWIGIDITWLAISAVKNRLAERLQLQSTDYLTEGEPRDMGAAYELAKQNRYQFQWWALSVIGARPVGSTPNKPREGKRGADEGVDGWMRFADGPEDHVEKIVVQVKSGDVGVRYIRELRDVVLKQKAAIGIFLTLEEPTKDMIKEAKSTNPYVSTRWNHQYSKIQILTIRELFSGKRPAIPTTMSESREAQQAKRFVTHKQETLFT